LVLQFELNIVHAYVVKISILTTQNLAAAQIDLLELQILCRTKIVLDPVINGLIVNWKR